MEKVIGVTVIGTTILDSMEFRNISQMNESNKRSSVRFRSTGCKAKPTLYEVYNPKIHDVVNKGTFYAHRSFVTPYRYDGQGNVVGLPSPIFDKEEYSKWDAERV